MYIEIIRHGVTKLQEEGRYQGSSDVPLSENGIQGLQPQQEQYEHIYITNKLRARQTAQILFPEAELICVDGLEEMDFGIFEGKNYLELTDEPAYQQWVDGNCQGKCPGGESKEEFCQRITTHFENWVNKLRKENVKQAILVAHGGTQMAVLERYARQKKDYFDWHLSSGMSYVLEMHDWEQEKVLDVVKIRDYRRT